jgi:hypothetical protein
MISALSDETPTPPRSINKGLGFSDEEEDHDPEPVPQITVPGKIYRELID